MRSGFMHHCRPAADSSQAAHRRSNRGNPLGPEVRSQFLSAPLRPLVDTHGCALIKRKLVLCLPYFCALLSPQSKPDIVL